REPQPLDAVDLLAIDQRPGVHKWVAGDLGLAFVLAAAVVAVAFWLKRGELPTKPAVPQPV
ncbi:MAG TPA: hypothetical protein VKA77_09905, partial [Mycobacterium sp.]|nr:hypothetical protein [Mycobacterium sp.]